MTARKLIDSGTSATLHDLGHIQTGEVVRAMVGDERTWEWAEGIVMGWREVDGERRPRVLFTFANGCKIEKTMKVEALRVVRKSDPTRIPMHSEQQFSPTMSHAEYQRAINNEDAMREYTD